MGVDFALKFPGVKLPRGMIHKMSELGSKKGGSLIKQSQCWIGMHVELCKPMPVGTHEKQLKDFVVILAIE